MPHSPILRFFILISVGLASFLPPGCGPPPPPGARVVVADDRTPPDPPVLIVEEEQARQELAQLKDRLKSSGKDPSLQFEIGILEARLGNWDSARSRFNKALNLNSGYAQAQYQIGLTWEHSGEMWVLSKGRTVLPIQREKAIAAYEKAINMDAGLADAHYRLAILALMDENINLARQAIQDLARIEPQSNRSHELLERLSDLHGRR